MPVASALTIADGIAVKRPGELTLRLIDQWVDDMAMVEEDERHDHGDRRNLGNPSRYRP